MRLFKIHGASDDLIIVEGLPGPDEFCRYSRGPYKGYFDIRSKSGSLRIHAIYDGHWTFAVGALDGDYDTLPDWDITREWGANHPHSETLNVCCPYDAQLHPHLEDVS